MGLKNMGETILWHNPRCSKSRQTLALLKENGISPTIVDYLKDRRSEAEIASALELLGITPIELMRKGESVFKSLGLSTNSNDETLVAAMVANPVLIERPLVFHGGRAAIGRPPENVLNLLK